MFLLDADQSLELKDRLADIKKKCEIWYEGAQVYKHIELLVSERVFQMHSMVNFAQYRTLTFLKMNLFEIMTYLETCWGLL